MKVEYDNRKYVVAFKHGWVQSGWPVRRERRECTQCLIYEATEFRVPILPLLAQVSVIRHFRDAPNREAARKAALAKALVALDIVGYAEATPGALKARRREFWEAYLNRRAKKEEKKGAVS
jgi:hypothetical protein